MGVKVCIKLHDKGNNFQNLSFVFMTVYPTVQNFQMRFSPIIKSSNFSVLHAIWTRKVETTEKKNAIGKF